MTIADNQAATRFELVENGFTAFASYRRDGEKIFILHVEAPPELRGTGAANRLMQGIATWADDVALTLVPICPYAVHWLNKNRRQ